MYDVLSQKAKFQETVFTDHWQTLSRDKESSPIIEDKYDGIFWTRRFEEYEII